MAKPYYVECAFSNGDSAVFEVRTDNRNCSAGYTQVFVWVKDGETWHDLGHETLPSLDARDRYNHPRDRIQALLERAFEDNRAIPMLALGCPQIVRIERA